MEDREEQKTLAVYESTKIRLDHFKLLTNKSTDAAISAWLDNAGVPSAEELKKLSEQLKEAA